MSYQVSVQEKWVQILVFFYENSMKTRQHFKSRKVSIPLLFIVLNVHTLHTQVQHSDQLMYH